MKTSREEREFAEAAGKQLGQIADGSPFSVASDPVLAAAKEGEFVGVEVACPRFGCGWTSSGTAVVVNEFGVRDPLPSRCAVHPRTAVRVSRVVEVVR